MGDDTEEGGEATRGAPGGHMTLWEHLAELRSRLVKS